MSGNNNPCCNTATFIGGYTPMDLRNASVYAQYKWYNKRCNDLGTGPNKIDVTWIPTYTTGQVSYNCPPGLNCQEGSCEITSESECMKWSFYPFDDTTTGASIDGTGTYLEFRKDERFPQLDERCYVANTALRRWCVSPESRNPSDSKSNPFAYNKDNGRCYLTKDYCDQQGMDYRGPDSPQSGDFVPTQYNVQGGSFDVGGKCTQSGGMEFAEALFGNTITRGFKSGCLIPSDRRYKTNIKTLCKDYIAPGVHLYYYNYNSDLKKKHPKFALSQIGFMSNEVKKRFPELIKEIDGIEYIYLDENIAKDKKYWRLINTIKFRNIILQKLLLYSSNIKDE